MLPPGPRLPGPIRSNPAAPSPGHSTAGFPPLPIPLRDTATRAHSTRPAARHDQHLAKLGTNGVWGQWHQKPTKACHRRSVPLPQAFSSIKQLHLSFSQKGAVEQRAYLSSDILASPPSRRLSWSGHMARRRTKSRHLSCIFSEMPYSLPETVVIRYPAVKKECRVWLTTVT